MSRTHENTVAKVIHSAVAGAVVLVAMRLLVNFATDGGPEFFDRLTQVCRFTVAAAISFGIVGYGSRAVALIRGVN